MIFSILHSVSQVLALAGLLSVFITTLMLWRRVRTSMKNYYEQSRLIASRSGEKSSPRSGSTHTIERHWPVILVVMCGLSLAGNAWLMWKEYHPEYPPLPTQYSDVRFLQRLDIQGYSWWMEKADGSFRADFCHDFDVPALNFQPGEVAWRFWFKDTGSCWSIKDGDIRFYRDKKDRWTIPTDVKVNLGIVLKGIKNEQR